MANNNTDLVDIQLKDQLTPDAISTSVTLESKEEPKRKTTCCILLIIGVLLIIGCLAAVFCLILVENNDNITQGSVNEEAEVCLLSIQLGDCNENNQRWGYDTEIGSCIRFNFTGCNGNKNNFLTKEKCLRTCAGPGGLPLTCNVLHDKPLSSRDVSEIFGTSSLLQDISPPLNIGTLRSEGALPTGHFASNEIHNRPAPMRLIPYSAVMTEDGITYDAYTFDRWNTAERSDLFHQQTPGKTGQPWIKLDSLGTGMKQMVSGPDSNPFGQFTGGPQIKAFLIW